jgi:putative flippase GtrA
MDNLLTRVVKFALVGGLGTVVNLGMFYLMVDRGGVNSTVGSIVCFLVAVTLNYFLNHFWTFSHQLSGEKVSPVRYLKYVSVGTLALVVNVAVLNLILHFFQLPLKVIAQGIGILCGMACNFLGANFFVFVRKRDVTND